MRRLAVGLIVALAAAAGLGLARPGPITAIDQEQPRLDQAATPGPGGLRQTFQAGRDGLSAIEILAVVFQADGRPELTLRLLDEAGAVIAAQTFTGLRHNAPLRLTFPPVPASAGRTFTLALEGVREGNAAVWAYSLDGYGRGRLLADSPLPARDLRFTTYYTYRWPDLLRDGLGALGAAALRIAPLGLVLFAPGLLLLEVLRLRAAVPDRWARWGLALALSLAVLPLVWQWGAQLGWRWDPLSLTLLYAAAGGLALARTVQRWRAGPAPRLRLSLDDLALTAVLLLGLAARLLAVRDLALPAWVDSPHHHLIARLLAETGSLPPGYEPVLPVDPFTYHFGWHVASVALSWLAQFSLAESMLFLGQVLNALMPLSIYVFVFGLTGRKGAGLAAVFFVGLISLFPAYYVSWGRYSQLTGLVMLAPLLAAAWRLTMRRAWPAAPRCAWLVLTGLLAGGLALTHYRVLGFFVVFALVALAAGRAGGWKWMAGAALLAAGLAAPWLWRLWAAWLEPTLSAPAQLAAPPGYNDFPRQYFAGPLERGWIACALLALAWGLWRRERAVWGVGGWAAVTFALLNLGPGSWLVNNNAWAISLFVPGALLVGWGAHALWTHARRLREDMETAAQAPSAVRRARWVTGVVLAAVLSGGSAYAGALGLRGQVAALNPATVLATADDREALDWVAAHISSDAVVLTNSWRWLNEAWAGPDGGAWLWPLTGRRTTMPPVDYIYEPKWEAQVRAFNERLAGLRDADSPETLALLREAGVTHIFIGARGGVLKPEMFVNSPRYQRLFSNGAAWVFAVVTLR